MRQLPASVPDPNLIVGSATADDAGVYRLTRDLALVQTADFFTPIVDDPYEFGLIAAANSLSDVYAMGGRPLTALNLLGVPHGKMPMEAVAAVLRGGLEKTTEAGCRILGGHTLRLPEPFYGLSVTGLVAPDRILSNAHGRPGDLLLLTKPLGTGVIGTGIKMGKATPAIARRAVRIMSHLNQAGAELAEKRLVRAATDITGYGLLGHLTNICRESGVSARVRITSVPAIGKEVFQLMKDGCIPGGTLQNLETANEHTSWKGVEEAQRLLVCDAQTSGGLLLCVSPGLLEAVTAILKRLRSPCVKVIGELLPQREQLIEVMPG